MFLIPLQEAADTLEHVIFRVMAEVPSGNKKHGRPLQPPNSELAHLDFHIIVLARAHPGVVKEQERNCSLLEGGITEAHGKGYRYREKSRIEGSDTVSHKGVGNDCGNSSLPF